jgi:2-keto-4-pentenoate hydratase
MFADEHIRLANSLADAWRDRRQLVALPGGWRPSTVAEGYAVQEAVVGAIGHRVAGWKIACTTREMQERYGVEAPYFGPIFEGLILESGVPLQHREFLPVGLEGEFAFRLGADIPIRKDPLDKSAVAEAVACIHPAIEVVSLRLGPGIDLSGPLAIADLAGNGAVVVGPAFAQWDKLDLANHAVSLSIDGQVAGHGTGRAALGHPFEALLWLVAACHQRGITPRAGQFFLTGSCTGIAFAPRPAYVAADYGKLGKAMVALR